MMDLLFNDPDLIPLPAEEVRIREFRLEPWPDGRRVKVILQVDPFQKRPSLEVVVWDDAGVDAAKVSVIESITTRIEFTIHLRRPEPAGAYRAQATLFYQAFPEVQEGVSAPAELPERQQVDSKESGFVIAI
ncbi:MAG: hypothetical protein MUC85_02760 [Anaerolineales bacterium]|jgi:hypothetical protein|nr:hypothetical protein [Anaerolineales bacterium]